VSACPRQRAQGQGVPVSASVLGTVARGLSASAAACLLARVAFRLLPPGSSGSARGRCLPPAPEAGTCPAEMRFNACSLPRAPAHPPPTGACPSSRWPSSGTFVERLLYLFSFQATSRTRSRYIRQPRLPAARRAALR